MHGEREDQVGGQLARAVEGGLAAAEGFVEGGGIIRAEVGDLLWGEGVDFAAAAGVGWRGLEGEEGGRGRGVEFAEGRSKGFVV